MIGQKESLAGCKLAGISCARYTWKGSKGRRNDGWLQRDYLAEIDARSGGYQYNGQRLDNGLSSRRELSVECIYISSIVILKVPGRFWSRQAGWSITKRARLEQHG